MDSGMTSPRLLDLYCGAGGAARGYHDAGFDVVGVDIEPQPNYPYSFIQMDALTYAAGRIDATKDFGQAYGFDAIHASPPCQAHSTLRARHQHIEYPDLVAATRELLIATDLPYVIENVVGAPLHNPITLCGSMFGLDVRRHRLFETSFPILSPPCSHGYQAEKRFDVYEHGTWRKTAIVPVYGHGGGKANAAGPAAMGIDWMTRQELTQAIPPAYTRYIGEALLQVLDGQKAGQQHDTVVPECEGHQQ